MADNNLYVKIINNGVIIVINVKAN